MPLPIWKAVSWLRMQEWMVGMRDWSPGPRRTEGRREQVVKIGGLLEVRTWVSARVCCMV